jgi:hypothetical protein
MIRNLEWCRRVNQAIQFLEKSCGAPVAARCFELSIKSITKDEAAK